MVIYNSSFVGLSFYIYPKKSNILRPNATKNLLSIWLRHDNDLVSLLLIFLYDGPTHWDDIWLNLFLSCPCSMTHKNMTTAAQIAKTLESTSNIHRFTTSASDIYKFYIDPTIFAVGENGAYPDCLRRGNHIALHWRHNGHDDVSNHQPRYCLLKRIIRRPSKKTSKLRVTGLCGEFTGDPWRASNVESVSIRWRHHGFTQFVWVWLIAV